MRALIHLVPRHRAEGSFETAFRAEIDRLRIEAGDSIAEINGMIRLEDDIFGPCTPYRGTIEIVGDQIDHADVASLVSGIDGRFGDCIHADHSTALVGVDKVFIEPERTPVRYQYLLRRNAEFSHEKYLDYNEKVHSQFGLKTPGIRGYVQLHLDLEASKALASAAGVGIWEVDSIAELYLDSVESFLSALGSLENDAGAREDAENFIDLERSYEFASLVDWQAGSSPVLPRR